MCTSIAHGLIRHKVKDDVPGPLGGGGEGALTTIQDLWFLPKALA